VLQQRTFHSFTLQDTVRLALFFEIGTACFLYKDELLRRRWVSGLAAVAAIVIGSLVRSQGLASAGLAVGIVVLGTRSSAPARRLRTLGDPSYGIYIYAFPIQQLLVWSGAVHSPMVMFPIATAASVAAGYASWHLIERPVMDWGKRHVRSRAARRPVDLREPAPVGSVTRSVG
jgi:peptidoglycan/LPS O-acetylase OafA/YrhL